MTTDQQIREAAATWSEGTRLTADELRREYLDYQTIENEEGREPLSLPEWAERIIGIPND